ncbi:hypothetical protein RMATCC62417_16036 [Rhizopus microsporus]|nr:hypothetical protein RMATCC62417_16036 [Rhizopus microsporus]
MIPRLPPVVLAAIAGAAVYGFKHVLDRLEPKAIGPPGSFEQAERIYKFRQNVKRAKVATAVSGLVYAAYWVYDSRQHRSTPAVLTKDDKDAVEFYKDQYSERDRRYKMERERLRQSEREHELKSKRQLEEELESMQKIIDNKK